MTWVKVVRPAAIVIVVWAVVLQVTAGVIIPPVLVVGIAFAALLAFLRTGWRWAGMAAAILGLVSVTGNIPSLVEELSHPSSALAFTLTLVAGKVAVWIDNRDGARHTFTAPDLGVDLENVDLKSQRVEFDASPGEYAVFCAVVGHEDMVGTLVVN